MAARRKKKPRHSYIIAALRKIWFWSDERKEAVKAAQKGPDLVVCQDCGKLMPLKGKAIKGRKKLWSVDHVEPCIPPANGFSGWDDYIERLFVSADGLQVLCNDCHQEKTNVENKLRRSNLRSKQKR